MKHLINRLSAFIVMLMCMSATAQAEIVHHAACAPTRTQRGFSQECWEDTETRKIYSDASCTNELERKEVITYAPFESSNITDMSSEFQSIGSQTDWDITFNWAARTTFTDTQNTLHRDERYVTFTVADDNAAYARLMWNKNCGDYRQGKFIVSVYVNTKKVYEVEQKTMYLEGVQDVYFKRLKKGDNVTFKVFQTGYAQWQNDGVFFTACFEYMIGEETSPEVKYDINDDDPEDPSDDITGTAMVVTKKVDEVTRFAAKDIAKVEWTTMAQTGSERYMVVTENNGKVTEFNFDEVKSVTWEIPQPEPTSGISRATIDGNEVDVNWIQLWEHGPKFAEYNVGVTDGKAESSGGYYAWGGSIDKDPDGKCKVYASSPLSGTEDTATNLWGSNWRMPTRDELQAILDNCEVEWTTVNDIKGCIFTGRGDYSSNSIFLPAAGRWDDFLDRVTFLDEIGTYWCSTPSGPTGGSLLYFKSGQQEIQDGIRRTTGFSIRAVYDPQ